MTYNIENRYFVGITYTPEAFDENVALSRGAMAAFKDRKTWRELTDLCQKHQGGGAFFTNMNAHDSFDFDNLEDALGFIRDTHDKPYVTSQVLVRGDRYKQHNFIREYNH